MVLAFRYMVLIALLAMCPQNIFAGMYRCVDANGKVSYTDAPPTESCSPMDLGDDIRVHLTPGSTYRVGGQLRAVKKGPARYDKYINLYGVQYNIDPHLIRAVIRTESGFNAKAVSKRGARGLMQLMPETAKELKVTDSFDPKQNIEGGTRYLRSLLNTFKQDWKLALAAYNAGPTIVKKHMKIPDIPETRTYVNRVLQYYREYKSARS